MAEAKRVRGERKAPKLPNLEPQDFKPALWDAVKKGGWTLEEAAYYAHGKIPTGAPLDPQVGDEVNQLYAWLRKEYYRPKKPDEPRLYNLPEHEDPPLFSPGDILRFLWEQHRHVSLKVWALYDAADKGYVDAALHSDISKENYKIAAGIVWERFPMATKKEVVNFLVTLPAAIHQKNGLPYFLNIAPSYLSNLLKDPNKRHPGRPQNIDTGLIAGNEQNLIELIRKELEQ